ncbi:LPXTG-motif cell wall anchor domain-containing protein/TQXA domain-containing protein [Amycolatopsis arida]|uniref:LPXTG-motif cell wall anchor domain-containing protein/TQXA domain-containing protein n=1 Tax=Amycolatopsis arida TaxID=587909 RepID=A0A1I5TWZ8_9PSEU|nr:thioester domain-containing protein [Amycolatopsis arida]TDX95929.1 LPXTG-motif cell wall-anchored protein/TQXA domain-containing protein [Amycolatopsis arida]SFP87574.1 LPXTG-motif cell wall anchor domain-containing protein/TQXA domain-containing protein [Amycolatopsis arida]
MRGKRLLQRTGAAVLGASMVVMCGALPATAESAKGRVEKKAHAEGYGVAFTDGGAPTKLFSIKLDGGEKLVTYCIQVHVDALTDVDMIERPWDGFPDKESPFHKNRDKINWVLHHSYPAIELADLEKKLTDEGISFTGGLDQKEAITGTQAAVWHFSDGKDLKKVAAPDESAADVKSLYDYLTGVENKGVGEQPTPALEVSPAKAEGKAGSRVGPFTVRTTGQINELVTELPEGVEITDADGKEIAPEDIKDGTELYFDVSDDAAAGGGAFELKGSAHLDTGRLFVMKGYSDEHKAQSMIVAKSDKSKLTAGAKGSWTAKPETPGTTPPETAPAGPTTPPTTEAPVRPQADQDDLAQTGFSALTPLLIGAGLLGAGAVTLLLVRRRRGTA